MNGQGGADILYSCGTPSESQTVVVGSKDVIVFASDSSVCES